MSTMIAEVYDAFVFAGAPTDKAAAAATAVADYDSRFSNMDLNFSDMDVKIVSRFARIEGDLLVLKWMTGVIVASVIALIFKAFLHG